MLEMPMRKTKSFICFEMLKEGLKFEFFKKHSNKKGNKYVYFFFLASKFYYFKLS
jgi:hypothetical protein